MNKKITFSMALMLMLSSQVHSFNMENYATASSDMAQSSSDSFGTIASSPAPTRGSTHFHVPQGIYNHLDQNTYSPNTTPPADPTSSGLLSTLGDVAQHGHSYAKHNTGMVSALSSGNAIANALSSHFTNYQDVSTNHHTGDVYGDNPISEALGNGDTTTTV